MDPAVARREKPAARRRAAAWRLPTRVAGVHMLAELNLKIVAELDSLAAGWTAVAQDMMGSAPKSEPRGRDRKRHKAKTKTKP